MSQERIRRFQASMQEKGIDATMVRTLSSFIYFAGTKWLRPALLIPADGEPVAFIFRNEKEEFLEKSWIRNVIPFGGVDDLIREVSGSIRKGGYRKVGFDMSVERDSYELFFHMFKSFTPQSEIVDVHREIMELRMIKDSFETECIRKASSIADTGMSAAFESIDVGQSELDVAAEAVYAMMKKGAESPHVYVNAGRHPRLHAEPRGEVMVSGGDAVMVTVAADYNNYFSNETRTRLIGDISQKTREAMDASQEMYSCAQSNLNPGSNIGTVEEQIGTIARERGFQDSYEKGFVHGVGLLVEEDPITTILIPERRETIREKMVMATIHTPLTVDGIGSIKTEDTFLIGQERAERLTSFPVLPE